MRRKNQTPEPAAVQLLSMQDVYQRLVAELGWDEVRRLPAGYDGWVPEDDLRAVAQSDRVISLAEKAAVEVVPGAGLTAADVDVMVAFARAERAHIEASRLRAEAAVAAPVLPDAVWTCAIAGSSPAQVEAAARERLFYTGMVPVKPGAGYNPAVAATFGPSR